MEFKQISCNRSRMMNYKCLFIDLDDTLWDTYHNNKECLRELYTEYRMGRFYTSFEAFFSIYMPNNVELWAKYRRGDINKQTLMIERFRNILKPLGITSPIEILRINDCFLEKTTLQKGLIAGAMDLLNYLKPKYRLFILSNGFREVQYLKLVNSGLAPFFEQMILSEDAKIQKPHKGIFEYALLHTNSKREESLMIGDCWDADILGAKNAGMDALWFNPKGESEQGFSPLFTVHSLEEIKKIL